MTRTVAEGANGLRRVTVQLAPSDSRGLREVAEAEFARDPAVAVVDFVNRRGTVYATTVRFGR
jgi:hypothetical protein